MRSLRWALLAVALTGGVAGAGMPPSPAYPDENLQGYRDPGETPETFNLGDLRVTLRSGLLKPPRGYSPLQVVLTNVGPESRPVRLSFEGHYNNVGRVIERTVEVAAHQRVVTYLPVPTSLSSGNFTVTVPGLPGVMRPVYQVELRAPILVLGSQQQFESGTAIPKSGDEHSPMVSVRFIDPPDAPRELAAYVGFPLVLVAADPASLPADVWSVLEAYAATGGRLVLLTAPRDLREHLPLLSGAPNPEDPHYGFGEVRVCPTSKPCGDDLLPLAPVESAGPVVPAGSAPRWERSNVLRGGVQPLLTSARTPVGLFLLVIFVFALAVGPGSLALARRKGPVAVLVAVPTVAFITCLALIGWSVLVDGFAVHSSRYSLTLLDRERSREVTLGLSAWYANLSGDPVHLPVTGVLLAPDDADDYQVNLDWTGGLTAGTGFLPARTYREWGELAVLPSRARLVLRPEGQGYRVQNALGAPLREGYLFLDGAYHELPALEDGAEGAVGPPMVDDVRAVMFLDNQLPVDGKGSRLSSRSTLFRLPPGEGGFVVRLDGMGPGPTASVPVDLEEGVHLVRGHVVEGRP